MNASSSSMGGTVTQSAESKKNNFMVNEVIRHGRARNPVSYPLRNAEITRRQASALAVSGHQWADSGTRGAADRMTERRPMGQGPQSMRAGCARWRRA